MYPGSTPDLGKEAYKRGKDPKPNANEMSPSNACAFRPIPTLLPLSKQDNSEPHIAADKVLNAYRDTMYFKYAQRKAKQPAYLSAHVDQLCSGKLKSALDNSKIDNP